MNSILQRWQRIHEIFDPQVPASAELRVGRRRYNPLSEEIAPRLRLPVSNQKFIIAGGIGSGKSTELRATADEVHATKLVVLVDLWRHFEDTVADPAALDHLQPAELVGLLGLAVLRAGRDALGHDWGELARQLERALEGIQAKEPSEDGTPKLDVGELSKRFAVTVGGAAGAALLGPGGALAGMAGGEALADGGLKVLEALSSATEWTWKIGLRDRARSSDQAAPVRAVLQATNALFDEIRRVYKREVVLLVDGLDRVQNAHTFEDLFIESGMLNDLRCAMVATLRLGLVQRYRGRLHWAKSYDFTYVPVALAAQPSEPDTRGLQFFQELAELRFRHVGVAVPIAPELVERLAYRSGGRLRDFISLMREVALEAMLVEVEVASAKQVDAAIDQFRRERESGLNAAHIGVLQSVLADPVRTLPAGEVALDLLDRQLLLAYPNETTWYLPHTILMLNLLRRTGSTGSV